MTSNRFVMRISLTGAAPTRPPRRNLGAAHEHLGMNMTRPSDARIRDTLALEMRRDHIGYREIATSMGYAGPSGAYAAVQRALTDIQAEAGNEVRAVELERLDRLAQCAQAILDREHFAYSTGSGKVITDPETGEKYIDEAPALAAMDRLLKIMDRRAKYLGLDAPTRANVEVTTVDSFDAKLRRLVDEMAELDEAATGMAPSETGTGGTPGVHGGDQSGSGSNPGPPVA